MNYDRGTIVYEIPTCILAVSLENRDDPTIFVAKGLRREEFAGMKGYREGIGEGERELVIPTKNGFARWGFAEAICKVRFLANPRRAGDGSRWRISRSAILAVASVIVLSILLTDPVVSISPSVQP